MSASEVVFLSGKRTPFGAFNGVFTGISATDLGVVASKAAIEQSGVQPGDIDHVIFGNVMQTSADAIYCARHIGLKCDVPVPVPAVTVNRLCGSGFESLAQAGQLLRLGEANVVLAGGCENMSQSPHTIRGARQGFRLGGTQMNDYLQEVLFDPQAGCAMAITAENLAEKYGISREDADDYGFRSQTAWQAAHEAGRYAEEITPVTVKQRRKEVEVTVDEHPQLSPLAPERFRVCFFREAMAKLRPVFKKDGTVTAANASGINDGAGAMVMTTAAWAAERKLQPLGRLIASASMGVEPKYMGIGPVAAIKAALARAGMSLGQMDLIEINEAFSSQYLACERELELDRSITNVNSGGVAVGHPLAATGTRITMHMLYELKRRGKKYGVVSACIGGGQGIALVVEAF
jgi:acetyl-CoA acetyltransferase family protein